MKKIILLLSFLFCVSPFVSAEELGLTLKECYQMALKQSETIAIQLEYIDEIKAQTMQAMSVALPSVSFMYTDQWQDNVVNRHRTEGKEEARFVFSQPLFTGFKEMAAIRANKYLKTQKQAELKRARQLLFADVVDAFYLYFAYQQDIKRMKAIEKILEDRLQEMKKREKIGKSRLSEVVSVEARLRRVQADLEVVYTQLEVSGYLLEFLIGKRPQQLIDEDLFDEIKLEDALLLMKERADITAAKEAVKVYEQQIVSARSALFPTMSLNANQYTKRDGSNDGNDWDISFVVNVPIFNGLNDYGAVQQAKSQKTQMELRFQQAMRMAYQQVQSAYVRYRSYTKRLELLTLAVKASEENYRLQKEDYERNLVNQLEVLQALEDLSTIERTWIVSKADARRSFWLLKVAMGEDVL